MFFAISHLRSVKPHESHIYFYRNGLYSFHDINGAGSRNIEKYVECQIGQKFITGYLDDNIKITKINFPEASQIIEDNSDDYSERFGFRRENKFSVVVSPIGISYVLENFVIDMKSVMIKAKLINEYLNQYIPDSYFKKIFPHMYTTYCVYTGKLNNRTVNFSEKDFHKYIFEGTCKYLKNLGFHVYIDNMKF